MKVNELRIGNWYDQFNNHHKATWATLKQLDEAPKSQLWCKPIPLTEEWLLKFGFERRQIKDLISYTLPKLELYQYASNNNKIFFEYADGEVELKYVHQLQNLYFALTGEELTYGGGEQ
jgi:hypothetical protein